MNILLQKQFLWLWCTAYRSTFCSDTEPRAQRVRARYADQPLQSVLPVWSWYLATPHFYQSCSSQRQLFWVTGMIWGGADKSLARPTSQCRRTESVVSLERGICSCAELQVFSCYRGWKEACQATCTISTTLRRELSSSLLSYKARHGRKFTPFWQKYYGNMHHHMPLPQTGWPSLNVVIFPPVMFLVLHDPKQWPSQRLLIKFMS